MKNRVNKQEIFEDGKPVWPWIFVAHARKWLQNTGNCHTIEVSSPLSYAHPRLRQ
jgi:hypothetical protein